jgi:hypothetical protein
MDIEQDVTKRSILPVDKSTSDAMQLAQQLLDGKITTSRFLKLTKKVVHVATVGDKLRDKFVVDEATGCWNYTGYIDQTGFGRIREGRRLISAHRVMWQDIHGAIDQRTIVKQSCGNLTCVNPDHLYTEVRGFMGNRYTTNKKTASEEL